MHPAKPCANLPWNSPNCCCKKGASNSQSWEAWDGEVIVIFMGWFRGMSGASRIKELTAILEQATYTLRDEEKATQDTQNVPNGAATRFKDNLEQKKA
mmetsp:Transcript_26398/g.75549  ORF Transcript_26398/g.75549 Transcript_26398/m.75549 type:complete len:98 (+) Transcript_26398:39-332(+)